jgi:hypothetical protein
MIVYPLRPSRKIERSECRAAQALTLVPSFIHPRMNMDASLWEERVKFLFKSPVVIDSYKV